MRKHKAGVVLIALQIALTLAIVCNAVFIIGQRIERVNRPTGLDESNLFLVSQQWVGAPSGDDAGSVEKLDSLQLTDLAALRALPDVASVAPINSLPLLNSSWNGAVDLKPGDTGPGQFQRHAHDLLLQRRAGARHAGLAPGGRSQLHGGRGAAPGVSATRASRRW